MVRRGDHTRKLILDDLCALGRRQFRPFDRVLAEDETGDRVDAVLVRRDVAREGHRAGKIRETSVDARLSPPGSRVHEDAFRVGAQVCRADDFLLLERQGRRESDVFVEWRGDGDEDFTSSEDRAGEGFDKCAVCCLRDAIDRAV